MISDFEISSVLTELETELKSVETSLLEADVKNKDYAHWKNEHNRILILSQESQEEYLKFKKSLESLQEFYKKHKKLVKKALEGSLSDTLNTWYKGANYNLTFVPTKVGKAEHYHLIDSAIKSDLETICGDSAVQVVGLLILNAILSSEGSDFLFLDEAFSNTDKFTAKEIGELLAYGLNDLQIILVENKADLIDNVDSLRYHLVFSEEGTGVAKIDDPFGEIEQDSVYRPIINNDDIIVDITQGSSSEYNNPTEYVLLYG